MIILRDITKTYNPTKQNEFDALCRVSCEIKDGELVAIIGKSGAGKSTVLHILACIDNYQHGEYWIDDTLVSNLSEKDYARIRNEELGILATGYIDQVNTGKILVKLAKHYYWDLGYKQTRTVKALDAYMIAHYPNYNEHTMQKLDRHGINEWERLFNRCYKAAIL